MVERLHEQESAQERNRHEARHQPSQGGAEVEGGEAFQQAQVDLAAPVDAVEQGCQAAVEPQQGIAADEVLRIGQVRELELIARQGVAQVAERQKAVFQDAVEQFVGQFQEGGALKRTARRQANVFDGAREHGPKAFADTVLAAPKRGLEQAGEMLAVAFGEPGHGQTPGRAADMTRDAHETLTGKRPLHRLFAAGKEPFHQVQGVNFPFKIEANFLQIIEQVRLGRAPSLVGLVEQFGKVLAPLGQFLGRYSQGRLQAAQQRLQEGDGLLARVVGLRCRRHARGPAALDGGPHQVAPLFGGVAFPNQLVKELMGRVRTARHAHPGIRRSQEARPLEMRLCIHILVEVFLDALHILDAGKIALQKRLREIIELQENRHELQVDPPRVGVGRKVMLLLKHAANLFEHRGPEPVDPFLHGRRRPFARYSLIGELQVDRGMKQQPPVRKQHLATGPFLEAVGRFQEKDRRRQQLIGPHQQVFLLHKTKQELALDDPGPPMGDRPHPTGQLEGLPDDLVQHDRRYQHGSGLDRLDRLLQVGR